MLIGNLFVTLLDNLKLQNENVISQRYRKITRILNRHFTNSDSEILNSLQVGSFGRKTAINNISDLDMVYILPDTRKNDYTGSEGASKLLNEIKKLFNQSYPNTECHIDECIVSLNFTDFDFEIQPVFEDKDGNFYFPDTYSKKFKLTKPRAEQEAINKLNQQYNGNVKKLCKILRAWKNKCGVNMSGILIDTLAYNFFKNNPEFKEYNESNFDEITEKLFDTLQKEEKKSYYLAPGSNQQVEVKSCFQKKAKKALNIIQKIRKETNDDNIICLFKDLFGRFILIKNYSESQITYSYKNTEEFIEEEYKINIKYQLTIDCNVSQDGFRKFSLREMIHKKLPLRTNKSLDFFILENTTPPPFQVKWKILNRGIEAERRNDIRGQIVDDRHNGRKNEHTLFQGKHLAECYIIKNNTVVARDSISVPITTI